MCRVLRVQRSGFYVWLKRPVSSRGRVDLGSVIHADSWWAYDGLVDLGYEKHFHVHHGVNEFAEGDRHINDIESFGAYSKLRLSQFRGCQNTHSIYT